MREDPIVYEDWQPSFAKRKNFRSLQYADGSLSLFYLLIILITAIQYKNAILIISSSLVTISYFFFEFVASQYNRAVFYRIAAVIGLIVIRVLFPINPYPLTAIQIEVVFGFLIVLKIALIPVLEVLNESYGEILIPRTKKVQDKLDYQLKVLSVTDFSIDLEVQNKIRLELLGKLLLQFVPAGLIMLVIVLVQDTIDNEFLRYFKLSFLLLIIFVSLLLQSVLFGPQLIKILREEGLKTYLFNLFKKINFLRRKKVKNPTSELIPNSADQNEIDQSHNEQKRNEFSQFLNEQKQKKN